MLAKTSHIAPPLSGGAPFSKSPNDTTALTLSIESYGLILYEYIKKGNAYILQRTKVTKSLYTYSL